MQLHVYTDPSAFDRLRLEWNELLRDSAADTLFLTWEWQSTWWHSLGEGDLLILTARAADGRLLGIAPLYRVEGAGGGFPAPQHPSLVTQHPSPVTRHSSLYLVGCVDVSDYLDMIVRRGRSE